MSFRTRTLREPGASRPARRLVARIALALPIVAGAGLAVPAISAADNIYWSDGGSAGAVRSGSVAGGTATDLFSGAHEPQGIALNPGAGTIYWAEAANGTIERGNLSGGTPETLYTEPGAEPTGVAINAAAGKLYWTDRANGKIQAGSINGGGTVTTLYQESQVPTAAQPTGLAISGGGTELFWTDEGTGLIQSGSTTAAGTGPGTTLYTEPTGSRPSGIAVNASAKTLYWTDQGTGTVRYAPITGPATPGTLYAEPVPKVTEPAAGEPTRAELKAAEPRGLALDLPLGTLYWGDTGVGKLQVGAFGGEATTPAGTLFGSESAPAYPVVLTAPAGEGAPQISGPYTLGQTLGCGTGKWAQNSPGADYYRAPENFAYQWQDNGTAIAGATAQTYTPAGEGSYTCVVTASNAAGSSTQVSPAAAIKATAPAVAITSPTNAASFEQGQVVPTAFSCTEGAGGPGLASCLDSNGAPGPAGQLNTATVGTFTYTVTATSKNGQKSTASITYTVTAKVVPPPPAPTVKPPKITITNSKSTVNGRRTHVTIACKGGKACTGKLSLTHVSVVRKNGVKRTSELLFARKPYSIAKGKQKVITIKISAKGEQMLKRASGHHVQLRVRATVRGGATKHRNVTLNLASARPGFLRPRPRVSSRP